MVQPKQDLLKSAQNIAIIGCSQDTYRTSHHIAKYLQNQGYHIIPINPNYDEILGEKVYNTLQDVPEHMNIDIADIFRNKKYTAEMVDQVIERVESTGNKITVWTQLDVSSPQAEEKAEQAGLNYIKNKCMMVEHQRLFSK